MISRFSLGAAAVLSAKPVYGLGAAFLDPQCLGGSNSAGVPHWAPTVLCLLLLGAGWIFWADKRSLWRVFGWLFLVGSSMFSTVPLQLGADIRLTAFEWPILICAAAVVVIRLYYALLSKFATYRRLAWLALAVLVPTLILPWAGPISSSYVAAVCVVCYGGLTALLIVQGWLYKRTEEELK